MDHALRDTANELRAEINRLANANDAMRSQIEANRKEMSDLLRRLAKIETPFPVESLSTRRAEARRFDRRCRICGKLTVEANRDGVPECAKHFAKVDRDAAEMIARLFETHE